MTEKRFELAWENFDGLAILDTTGEYSDDEDYIDWLSGQKAVDVLNHFAEENEQLKQSYIQLKHRHSLLHDECLDAECDRDSYHKDVLSLEKENEQLKEEIKDLNDVLARYEEKELEND